MSWFILRGIQAYRIARPGCRSLVLALIAANLSMMGLSMGIEAMYQRHWWVILALTATVYNLARADKTVSYTHLITYDTYCAKLILQEAAEPGVEHIRVRPNWDRRRLGSLALLALPLGIAMLLISLNANIPRYICLLYTS